MVKKTLSDLLIKENAILDNILDSQSRIHVAVKEKDWISLECDMENVKALSTEFSELELEREVFFADNAEISENEKQLAVALHSKLLKSKIENQALSAYIGTTRNFIHGILDNVVPQRRNVLYSRNGKIIKHEPESVVLNKVL